MATKKRNMLGTGINNLIGGGQKEGNNETFPASEKKKIYTSFRLDEDARKRVRVYCAKNDITFSDFVENVLIEYKKEHNIK